MELELRRRLGKDRVVKELPTKKIGRPLTMGEDLDKQVQTYITDLGKVGGEGTRNCQCQENYTEKGQWVTS